MVQTSSITEQMEPTMTSKAEEHLAETPLASELKAPIKRKRSRRNSGALMEQHAPDWIENYTVLRAIHDYVYPPGSKWYWYRRGKISHSLLSPKYWNLVLVMFIMAFTSSGYCFPLLLILYSAFLRQSYELSHDVEPKHGLFEALNATDLALSQVRPEWYPLASEWWFIILQCLASAIFTSTIYVANGMYLINKFYVQRKNDPENWKCQPDSFLTPERWREEKMLGTFNSFLAGIFGTGLFFLHLNYPFLKFYYETGTRGMFHFFLSVIACYLWIGKFY